MLHAAKAGGVRLLIQLRQLVVGSDPFYREHLDLKDPALSRIVTYLNTTPANSALPTTV